MFLKAKSDRFPKMVKLVQHLYNAPLGEEGLITAVRREFQKLELGQKIGPGKSVAIGAGSRGIASINLIVRTLVEEVKALGGEPFVFPAMGSHGGGTAEGQKGMLESLGITEEFIGCPIKSSMEVVQLGESPSGLPVYLDKYASQADAIIAVNRIKPHTNFRGSIESGLHKMLAIGMGKHSQAIALHIHDTKGLRDYMPEVARALLERAPIVAGFAILEDGYHHATKVAGVLPADFGRVEEGLLEEARRTMAKLPVKDLDLLIVEQMGKNISGTGMDTNVIGRCRLLDLDAFPEPKIRVVLALDLTEETHGNATGVGLADVITRRLDEKVDWQATYINCVTGGGPAQAFRPVVMDNEQDALRLTLDYLLGPIPPEDARVIRIKDTLSLTEMEVSEAVMRELQGRDGFEFAGELRDMEFDEAGWARKG